MFIGFPEAALDFYDDLEADNTRTFWTAHVDVYESCVRTPMKELADGLEKDFGEAKLFRPYRDVRFSKDKTPYKTYQDLYVPAGPALGWYLRISAPGVEVGAGFYDAPSDRVRALREVIAGPRGGELQKLIDRLVTAGFERTGDRVATVPRGFDKNHPRIELLRHRTLAVRRQYGFEPVVHSPELLAAVRKDWKACRPLVEWLGEVLSALTLRQAQGAERQAQGAGNDKLRERERRTATAQASDGPVQPRIAFVVLTPPGGRDEGARPRSGWSWARGPAAAGSARGWRRRSTPAAGSTATPAPGRA